MGGPGDSRPDARMAPVRALKRGPTGSNLSAPVVQAAPALHPPQGTPTPSRAERLRHLNHPSPYSRVTGVDGGAAAVRGYGRISLAPPYRPAGCALRENQPPAPFRHWRLWPIPASLLRRVKFTPATTSLAPDHKSELGRSGAFEGHRRASVGFHIDAGYIAPCSAACNAVLGQWCRASCHLGGIGLDLVLTTKR
jgi:hypothetical protein